MDTFHSGVFKLMQCWKKCTDHSEDFVEKQKDVSIYYWLCLFSFMTICFSVQ
jgi:hypothetical protein